MHVKRTGHFKIRVTCEGIKLINKEIILQADFSGVPSSFAFFLRLMLVRDHYGFTHIPVDQVMGVQYINTGKPQKKVTGLFGNFSQMSDPYQAPLLPGLQKTPRPRGR